MPFSPPGFGQKPNVRTQNRHTLSAFHSYVLNPAIGVAGSREVPIRRSHLSDRARSKANSPCRRGSLAVGKLHPQSIPSPAARPAWSPDQGKDPPSEQGKHYPTAGCIRTVLGLDWKRPDPSGGARESSGPPGRAGRVTVFCKRRSQRDSQVQRIIHPTAGPAPDL